MEAINTPNAANPSSIQMKDARLSVTVATNKARNLSRENPSWKSG
jgi:hypothetical protein